MNWRRATDAEIAELREMWVNNETLDRVLLELRKLRGQVGVATDAELSAFAGYRASVAELSVVRAIPVFDGDQARARWHRLLSLEARVASDLATMNLRIGEAAAEEMTR